MALNTPSIYEFDARESRYRYAWDDIKRALSRPQLIFTLVRASFFNRYQNTALGAFWLTATTLLMVSGLALLYGQILGADLRVYFPYVASGVIVWGLLSALVNEGAAAFILGSSTFNETPIAKSVFALRSVGLAYLNFVFRVLVLVFVLAFTRTIPSLSDLLLSLLGLLIIAWTGFGFILSVGVVALRFRDILQLANAVMTVSFLLTPVFWQPGRLGHYEWAVNFNPFYHYINIVRGPLLDQPNVGLSFAVAVIAAVITTFAGAVIFGQFARRLNYWS